MNTFRHSDPLLKFALPNRREILRVGGLGAFGLTLPQLLTSQVRASSPLAADATGGKAKACIVLFLMGGPPQHSTWDPKPEAPAEVRGEFKPIATKVPGLQVCELMPRTAQVADKVCVLRAMASDDNAHSSSGYAMLTGHAHTPKNFENANPGAPNDHPSLGGLVRKLQPEGGGLPSAVTIPGRIFNTDGSVWPGQTAGHLGRSADPWLFTFDPSKHDFRIDEFSLPGDVSGTRLEGRTSLLHHLDRTALAGDFDRQKQKAFDVLRSSRSRQAFRLDQESPALRDRYGQNPFGRSVLLARRLVEAGVKLVQVNWYRGPDEPPANPCWDSHVNEAPRLKNVLMPGFDQAYAALLSDLSDRGLLEETLVVCMAEFGRSPKLNGSGGRDHWGHVYSAVLAGGGVRGGQVIGASDRLGAHPKEGRVLPQDLTATIFHSLGYRPDFEVRDTLGRPLPISRGEVLRQAF